MFLHLCVSETFEFYDEFNRQSISYCYAVAVIFKRLNILILVFNDGENIYIG